MILPDTAIWADHLRQANPLLQDLLAKQEICIHPAVIGEIAMGRFKDRQQVLFELLDLSPHQSH